MEASALTHAGRRGLLARRSPLLRLQGDERLVALLRNGNDHAFEAIVDRYQARLLGFCRQMLRSTEDAEDVLQEVFVNAHRAMLADDREINLRPWLYRIARNRCLNHLRKPVADGQDSMDMHPIAEAANTHERVQNREEFRQLLTDVGKLPETQRSALLLREMDAMSYEEISQAMETTVPSVKSLLVRARIALAEASEARQLTCGEVRLELAEAAEGLGKATGPVRRHVRDCEGCRDFRNQLRSDSKVLAALFPVGPLLLVKGLLLSKLGFGGAGASGSAAGAGAGGAGASGAAIGGAGAGAGGIGALGGAIGAKTVAGVVTAAVITAGAVEVEKKVSSPQPAEPTTRFAAPAPVLPAPLPHHQAAPKERAESKPAKAAPATATDEAALASEPSATAADDADKDKHAKKDEAGASTTSPTVTVAVTESSATTTVTTGGTAGGGGGAIEESPPPPPPAQPPPEEEPPGGPPAEEPPPPAS
ncbi:MAG: sigma-70 family RNA polymerase sigma factor [Actinomycetota bacterium]